MQLKTFSIIPVFFALSYLGECEFYNEPEPIPESILGQWQEIVSGNDMFPVIDPQYYHIDRPHGYVIEFLTDGTYHCFFSNGTVITRSYQVDAEFVYFDGGTPPDGHTYRYGFIGTNMLRMDYVKGYLYKAMDTPTYHIFERVKNE
jgi:hypothetical protein